MTLIQSPGAFSQAMYGEQQASLLEAAFDRCLGLELDETRMDAQEMGKFATTVAAAISDHFEELSAALPLLERQNVERIALDNGTETRGATVEYLANAYLFRAIRDYFDLPPRDVFPQLDSGGFLVFTLNGSIVASPPEDASRRRTLHYTRMPSRTTILRTSSQLGSLLQDITVGHRLKTSAFVSSAIRRILYVPLGQAHLFDAIRDNVIAASTSVSVYTRGH